MIGYFSLLTRRVAMAPTPKVVFVLGGPGAGKGTACYKIVEQYGFLHLSAGDLLREERARAGSDYGELIESHIRDGKIVPVEITCSLLEKAMQTSGKTKFLIDGFPRNQNNLDGWNKTLAAKVDLLFVLYLECSEDICISRCLKRGASGSGRSDDNIESMRKRMQTFINETKPIIDHYEKLNLVRTIDGRKTPEEVFNDIQELFDDVPLK